MPYTPSGGYYESNRGKKIDLRPYLKRKGIKPAAARLGPSVKRVAVLICFEGPDAEKAAIAYHKVMNTAVNENDDQMITPSSSIAYHHFNATPKFVALHDCVKHPLKY